MNSGSEDPEILLSEPGQWTEPWGDNEHGHDCSKCEGEGSVECRCWSCLLSGADPDCPMCGGRVQWTGACPVCRGTGIVDGRPRRGVSVFPTREGLYHYMTGKGADVE